MNTMVKVIKLEDINQLEGKDSMKQDILRLIDSGNLLVHDIEETKK